MKLGKLVQEYREFLGLSQRQFATLCKLSNGYISLLEEGINPKTQLPITPTFASLEKIAQAMKVDPYDLQKIDQYDIYIDVKRVMAKGDTSLLEAIRNHVNQFFKENPPVKKDGPQNAIILCRKGRTETIPLTEEQLDFFEAFLDTYKKRN